MSRKKVDGLVGTVDAKLLRAALKDVAAAVEARSTIPILSSVVTTFATDQIALLGTDLDLWIERTAPADVSTPFAVTIEAATLGRLAGKIPDDAQVSIRREEGKVVVTAGRSRFTLPTLPVEDFPSLPGSAIEWDAQFEMDAIHLERALARTAHAISTEETRYYLNGVFLHVGPDGDGLRFATTDGHRLARVVVDLPDGAGEAPGVILPRKAARVLAGLLAKQEGRIDVAISRTKVRFVVGDTTLTTKTIDGTYPDYTRVIPTANERLVRIGPHVLSDALGRVITVSSDKTRTVKIDLARDVLTLSVASPEHGTAVEEVPCDYAGSPMTIGFNGRYMLDTLGQLAADTVEIAFGADPATPVLLRDREDAPALFVLMPHRV